MKKIILSMVVCVNFACAGVCSKKAQEFINYFEGKCEYSTSDTEAIYFTCEGGHVEFYKDGTWVHFGVYGEPAVDYSLYGSDGYCTVKETDKYGMKIGRTYYKSDGTKPSKVYKDFKEFCLK